MKTLGFLVFVIALFFVVFFFLLFPKKEVAPHICVSMAPLKCFADRIVQDKFPVVALLHAGQNHETYEISPKDALLLMQMKLYFSTDFPFERGWVEKIKKMNKQAMVVDLQKEVFPNGEKNDPHIWTSPLLAKKIAKAMVENIVKIDPRNEAFYRRGYESLLQDLDALDREIRDRFSSCRGGKFYVLHPAWGYFASDYGLEEVAIEREGKEPSLQELVDIMEEAKKDHVKVIFVQKGVSQKSAEGIAHALSAKIEEIDPIEEDYFSNLRKVSWQIQKAIVDETNDH